MKSKGKFHFTGLYYIALVIPLFAVFYLIKTGPKKLTGIPLAIPDKEHSYIFLPDRKFISFDINGDKDNDTRNLLLAQREIQKMILSKDTIHAIKFSFGNKARYNEYVAAIDICLIEKPTIFSPENNDIEVYNFSEHDHKLYNQKQLDFHNSRK